VEETTRNLQSEHEEFVKQVNEESHKPNTGTGKFLSLFILIQFLN
jgi:hypothetical protein